MPYTCDICNTTVYKVDLDQVGLFVTCAKHGLKLRELRGDLVQKLIDTEGQETLDDIKDKNKDNKYNPNDSFEDRIIQAAKNNNEEEVREATKEIIEKLKGT